MLNVKLHNENLCSIAGFENSVFGRFAMKEILNEILKNTEVVDAEVRRPYYEIESSKNSIPNILGNVKDFEVSDEWFSISFVYYVYDSNSNFVETFTNLWFEYEQVSFCFFVSVDDFEKYKIGNHRMLSWIETTELYSSYVVFRAVEEKVIWIGKSNTQNFDAILSVV
jgi:hypothetical protein